jgi:hypothetical protein
MNEGASALVGDAPKIKKKILYPKSHTLLKILLALKALGITLCNNIVASPTPKSSSTDGHHVGSSMKIRSLIQKL